MVVRGTAASVLCESATELLPLMMKLIEGQEYMQVLQLAKAARTQINLRGDVYFSVTLMQGEEGNATDDAPDAMHLSNANILHYALCVCGFDEALLLLLLCPGLRTDVATVRMTKTAEQSPPQAAATEVCRRAWTALELTAFFDGLYNTNSTRSEYHARTGEAFREFLVLLQYVEEDGMVEYVCEAFPWKARCALAAGGPDFVARALKQAWEETRQRRGAPTPH